MPRLLRIEFSGAKYHITSRGNGRESIYYAQEDRERFAEQLQQTLEKDQVILYAYSMMVNHYHLLVETSRCNLHAFMQRLNTAYGMYFRYKRRRPGHCFQGRYSAQLVKGDDYLVRLTRYIHLNPIKTKEMEQKSPEEKRALLQTYPWSSYRGYVAEKYNEEFVDYRWLGLMHCRCQAANRRAYARHVDQFIDSIDPVMSEAYERSEYAIGDDDFVQEIEDRIFGQKKNVINKLDIRWPAKKNEITIDTVFEAVAAEYGITVSALRVHGRSVGEAKGILIEVACRTCKLTQRTLAVLLGTSEHAIGKQRKRFGQRLKYDQGLQRRMNKILGRFIGK